MKTALKSSLGLMSGTSMDGIDMAILHTDGKDIVKMGDWHTIAYNAKQRKILQSLLIEAKKQKPDFTEGEKLITQWHCQAVKKFLQKIKQPVDIIGFHGQTVLHRPDKKISLQLGLGKAMAKKLNIDVVFNFRQADIQQGGQGAPLACIYHKALAGSLQMKMPVAFLNLGGIANVTYIDKKNLIAFDCGPANCLSDQWIELNTNKTYDENGNIAKQGKIIEKIVENVLANSFFQKRLPKSADRLEFPPLLDKTISLEDGARSLIFATAQTIKNSQIHFPQKIKTWIICGGGRHNKILMNDLQKLLTGQVINCDELNLNGDIIEAQAFAYLAVRSKLGLPISFPTTTGCKTATSGGVLATSGLPLVASH